MSLSMASGKPAGVSGTGSRTGPETLNPKPETLNPKP